MQKFEFFQSANLRKLQTEVNGWIEKRSKKIDIISWDFQKTDNVFTMTIFYSEREPMETAGFKS